MQRKRRKGVGSVIRRSIPVRTFADWRDPPPGFFEIDMVEHCGGPKTDGEFVHTLTLTDIPSGWTECVAMRTRNQVLVIEAEKVATDLPFAMRGVDSDNDTAFMNQSVFDYCKGHGLEQTRPRADRRNDRSWVEQRNGSVVRRLVGYGRLSSTDGRNILTQLYASSRLYINFFQPSFKLKSRTSDGARTTSTSRRRRPAIGFWHTTASDPLSRRNWRRSAKALSLYSCSRRCEWLRRHWRSKRHIERGRPPHPAHMSGALTRQY
ncbi:hypothetical protein P0D69_43190 [Paraburkholderia sediminicola]|uniref:hypothetical protein n=1 Tax=Paraburkholderia sediminicola TaxID=458836 RepID=UPI0038BD336D